MKLQCPSCHKEPGYLDAEATKPETPWLFQISCREEKRESLSSIFYLSSKPVSGDPRPDFEEACVYRCTKCGEYETNDYKQFIVLESDEEYPSRVVFSK